MEEVGGYQLVERIGSGGMGVVYHALDADGRDVALKILHPQISADPAARARLAREVDLMHRVRGKGVARVLDAEVEDEIAFVVTELIDGPTLEEQVEESGVVEGEDLAELAKGLASALRAIHRVGVVHRDLKPGNVMMSEDGPVLIDFGIAQVADDTRLTQTGMVTGTPGFLDPELVDGADPSPTADWWSWAAVLVFATTGRRPFGGGPSMTVLARMARGDVDVDGVAPMVADALRAALRPDSAERLDPEDVISVLEGYWDADDLADALGAIAGPAEPPTTVIPGGTATSPDDLDIPGGFSTQSLPTARPSAGATQQVPGGRGGDTRKLPTRPVAPQGYAPAGSVPLGTSWDPTPSAPYGTPGQAPYGYGGGGGLGGELRYGGPAAVGPPAGHPGEIPTWLRPAPSRAGTVAALWVLLAAATGLWPGWSLVAFVSLFLLAGALGMGARQTREARLRRGRRAGDAAREIALYPVNLVGMAFLAILPLLVGAGIAWATAKGTAYALTLATVPELGALEQHIPLWAGAAAGMLATWFVPGAGAARDGARVGLGAIFPVPGIRVVFALVCLAFATIAVVFAVSGGAGAPSWPPLPQLLWL